jgi:hypothetical protein
MSPSWRGWRRTTPSGGPIRESVEVWAPVHAWRALGDLGAEEAIGALVALLSKPDPDDFDDALSDEFPDIMERIGPAAVPALAAYLRSPAHGVWPRVTAGSALAKIGAAHPAARDTVVSIISRALDDTLDRPRPPREDDDTLVGFLISDLVTLRATESAATIERAFSADRVDLTIAGDLEDVQIDLGLRTERTTPKRNYILEAMSGGGPDPFADQGFDPDFDPDLAHDNDDYGDPSLPAQPAPGSAARRVATERKAKSKRKMAQQSRKQNRKGKKK